MMGHNTNYLRIHENNYVRLRANGAAAWSDDADIQYRVDLYTRTLKADSAESILVLGCGDGEVSLGLAANQFNVTGIDISPTAVRWAKEKAAKRKLPPRFLVANALELALPEIFDAVIDDHCFHCIVGEDRSKFLATAFRHLKPGGIFLLRTQCGDPPANESTEFLKTWDHATRCQVQNNIAGRYFGLPDDILAEVKLAGFSILRSELKCAIDEWQMLEIMAQR